MSQEKDSIQDLLDELRKQIDQVQSEGERQRMTALANDIEARMETHLNEDRQQELIDDLREEVLEFEVEHPRTAATMHSLINMLSNIGL